MTLIPSRMPVLLAKGFPCRKLPSFPGCSPLRGGRPCRALPSKRKEASPLGAGLSLTYWLRAVRLPAAPAAATTTATIATAAVLARLRLVDRQRAALQLGAVQGDDRRLRLRLVRHLDEAEAAGATRVAVRRYARGCNRAVRRESGLEVALARVKTKVSNVNVQVVLLSLLAPVGAYGYRCRFARTIDEVPGNVKAISGEFVEVSVKSSVASRTA